MCIRDRYVVEALEAAPDFEIAGIVRRSGAENKPAELEAYAVAVSYTHLADSLAGSRLLGMGNS